MAIKVLIDEEDNHIVLDMDNVTYEELMKVLREMGNSALNIAQVLSMAFMKLANIDEKLETDSPKA